MNYTPFFNPAVTDKVAVGSTGATAKHKLGYLAIYNPNASLAYLQIHAAPAASVNLGTTVPAQSYPILATASLVLTGIDLQLDAGGLTIAATTTSDGATVVGTGLVVSGGLK